MKAQGIPPHVKEIVDLRANGFCEFCCRPIGEIGWFSRQHRIPRGAGGSRDPKVNSVSNLIVLCGSATSSGCHLRAESQRHWAKQVGLLLDRIQDPANAPVLYQLGWARLDNEGGVHFLSEGEAEKYSERMNRAAAILKERGINPAALAMMNAALAGESVPAIFNEQL